MFLLVRQISPYTGADVLLGVFTSAERAESCRAAYLERRASGQESDPWRDQAYRDRGLTSSDVLVRPMAGPSEAVAEVFVVSHYLEGFGQIVRKFDSIHASESAAEARIAAIEADPDAHYALSQRARIDVLLSDARDDQPGAVPLTWRR